MLAELRGGVSLLEPLHPRARDRDRSLDVNGTEITAGCTVKLVGYHTDIERRGCTGIVVGPDCTQSRWIVAIKGARVEVRYAELLVVTSTRCRKPRLQNQPVPQDLTAYLRRIFKEWEKLSERIDMSQPFLLAGGGWSAPRTVIRDVLHLRRIRLMERSSGSKL